MKIDYTNLSFTQLIDKIEANRFFDLPRMVREAFRRLLTRVEALEDSPSGGGGVIQTVTNTDGNITVTGSNNLTINITPSLLSVINSALQAGDSISDLNNDAGYITISDVPTNTSDLINDSGFIITETDPIFQASEASLFVAGDKANLDNQSGINTGDETTSSIQTKRPLKTVNNESLEGVGNIQIDYNDLDNLPTLITNHSGLSLDDGSNPHGTTKNDVGLGNVPNIDTSTTSNITDSTNKRFVTDSEKTAITHSNRSILDAITESFTTALKTAYDSTVTWISTNGTNILNHISSTSNPHNVTKTQVGLSNVDNTSDLNKPISTATQSALNLKLDKSTTPSSVYATDASGNQEMVAKSSFQTALGFTPENVANKENTTLDTSTTKYPTNNLVKTNLDLKQDTLVSGTSIKTIEGQSILGSGNIDLNKSDVGLGNVDNTSDVNKPISSATQNALNNKADLVGGKVPATQLSEVEQQLQRYWYSVMANTINTTLLQVNNTNSFTVSGTASVVPRSGTTYYNSIAMNNYLSATANGSNCGVKNNNQGDGSYLEGFDSSFVFINNDTNINCETTVGYYGLLTPIPNIDKVNYTTNLVCVGNDVGDTNLSFYCKRNTVTPNYVKVDCGSGFPAHTTTDAYIFRMQMSRGYNGSGRTLKMTITNIITGAVFSHTFTDTQIPSHTANIAMVVNRSNRNSGVATNIRFSKFHQTKYIY